MILTYNEKCERGVRMRWRLDLDEKYNDVHVTIQAPEMTDEILKLTTYIDQTSQTMIVKKDEQQLKIPILSMIYIENIERTTFVYTELDMYEVDSPLYEMEEKLKEFGFVRINKQTLLNPRHIQSVRALLNSRFELQLENGEKLIVTRHYRKAFKRMFEEGGFYDA